MDAATPQLYILWDDAHIWGLIAVRAVRAMGVPHRLVLGADIADGLLSRRPPAMLLVPGGNARHKAEFLGEKGLAAIRAYVASGGHYLGFCGGAGLALSSSSGQAHGLALCPWQRGSFDDRIQHFMSGHLHMRIPPLPDSDAAMLPPGFPPSPALPVWWPGRFAPQEGSEVTVLAAYEEPAQDFWLADLPTADLPEGTFAAWKDLYGVTLTPSFLEKQPCVVHGHYGKGDYILSYSHLETPDSPDANRWFAHLLRHPGGLSPHTDRVPAWAAPEAGAAPAWEDPALQDIYADIASIMENGLTHGMLFQRTGWLLGWRAGLPGASLNNLWAAVRTIRDKEPSNAAYACFTQNKDRLREAVRLFSQGCTHYLLAERLAQTVSRFPPQAVSPELLRRQREDLFGPPMLAGGAYRDIMDPLDRLAYLQLA